MKDGCCSKVCNCDCTIIHEEVVSIVNENISNEDTIDKLVNIYKIFSDKTRLKIMLALEIESLCVCDIANVLNMTKSAVSHQLKILRDNNLISFKKVGKNCYYSLADDHIKQIIDITLDHTSHC